MCKVNNHFRKDDNTINALKGMVFFFDLGDQKDNKLGTIIKKCRPCVIVSRDERFNEENPESYNVVPISSRGDDAYYFDLTDVLFKARGEIEAAVVHQETTVSYLDMKNFLYILDKEIMDKIDIAIQVHHGYLPYTELSITEDDLKDYKEYKQELEKRKYMQNNTYNISPLHRKNIVSSTDTDVDKTDDEELSEVDVAKMRKSNNNNWTEDEVKVFFKFCATHTTDEATTEFNISKAQIYQVKYKLKNKFPEIYKEVEEAKASTEQSM